MKFEAVRIRLLSEVFGLLSSKNFATMATWRKDFSSLLTDMFISQQFIFLKSTESAL